MPGGADQAGDAAVLRALDLPFASGRLAWPEDGRVLFLGARADAPSIHRLHDQACCVQPFKPFADAVAGHGLAVAPSVPERLHPLFALALVLPSRQRALRQAELARAVASIEAHGVVVTAAANRDGAASLARDFTALTGAQSHLSKFKCRVMWAEVAADGVDHKLLRQWLEGESLRTTDGGLTSRPGLFAWDHVDPASALLADHLPADLAGDVADLGAGAGYLSVAVLHRCAAIQTLDVYEADARALPAARANLDAAMRATGRPVEVALRWHDVGVGLPKHYDAIVMNPPFHVGHADAPALGQAFIIRAADALKPGGALWLVANRHLPYEAVLAKRFTTVRSVCEDGGFKVIEAHK